MCAIEAVVSSARSRVITAPISTSEPPDWYLVSACMTMSTPWSKPRSARPADQVLSSATSTPFSFAALADGRQVRHFHRHRTRRLGPDQLRVRLDQLGDAGADQRIVVARGDAEVARQPASQFAVRVVDVLRQQHVVAGLQQREIDHRDRRQAARRQQAVFAAFDLGQPRFQREGGRRAVQAVGIGVLVFPLAERMLRDVLEQHGRGVVDRARGRRRSLPAPCSRCGSAVVWTDLLVTRRPTGRARRPW
jgi:hypothetical protein